MTLRSSDKRQWWVRLAAATVLALAAHVIVSRLAFGELVWSPFVPEIHRLYLIFGALFALFAWETRPDEGKGEGVGEGVGEGGGVGELQLETTTNPPAPKKRVTERTYVSVEPPKPTTPAEALYIQARAIRHASPPNIRTDGRYLQLLKDAVDAGSRPAMVKFGQYAMRRRTFVEAHYWFTRAQSAGEPTMEKPIADAIKLWKKFGRRDQSKYTYRHFTSADYRLSAEAMTQSLWERIEDETSAIGNP